MAELKPCPKCGAVAGYNSWFSAYYCTSCGELFKGGGTTMAEYIEHTCGECLHSEICEHLPTLTGWDALNPAYCRAFRNAADVAPVVHGRWIGLEYDGYADGFPVYDLWECSECGNEVRGEDVPETHPYCHGCGAKMAATE